MMYGNNYFMASGMMILMMVGMIASYIIILLAVWRLMRAHEQIAESVKDLTQIFKSKSPERES